MAETRPRPAEFRRKMVERVRAGRDPTGLWREFEPFAQAIRNWVADADRSEGRREAKPAAADSSLTTAERNELVRLRRENRQPRRNAQHPCSRGGLGIAREAGVLPSESSSS